MLCRPSSLEKAVRGAAPVFLGICRKFKGLWCLKTMSLHFYKTVAVAFFAIAIGFFVGFICAIHWVLNVSPWQAAHDLWYSLVDGARFR